MAKKYHDDLYKLDRDRNFTMILGNLREIIMHNVYKT